MVGHEGFLIAVGTMLVNVEPGYAAVCDGCMPLFDGGEMEALHRRVRAYLKITDAGAAEVTRLMVEGIHSAQTGDRFFEQLGDLIESGPTMVTVHCPRCNHLLERNEQMIQQTIQCPRCAMKTHYAGQQLRKRVKVNA